MPGSAVQIPNLLWLVVLICGTISNFNLGKNEKYGILKFTIGEIIAICIIIAIDFILSNSIKTINNAVEINEIINNIIIGISGIGIISYSIGRFLGHLPLTPKINLTQFTNYDKIFKKNVIN